jgi:ABC-2 type transport system permease protein
MTTITVPGRPARRRPALSLLAHQVRYEQLSFWRNPQSAVFTFAFPVLFIVIIGALLGRAGASADFGGLTVVQYYVPTIAAVSVLGSCYGQLAMTLAARRQYGVLKRARATPIPAWAYFAGLVVHCVLVSLADIVLITVTGALFGMPLPSDWPMIGLTLALGAACFCALGVAMASVIANADAAPAVAQLVLFPVLFLSGTYLPVSSAMLNRVMGWLPVQPFNQALLALLGHHAAPGGRHLAVLAAWGAAGAVIAVRRFRWDPRPE